MDTRPMRPPFRRRVKRAARKLARGMRAGRRDGSTAATMTIGNAELALRKAREAHSRYLVDLVIDRARREGIVR